MYLRYIIAIIVALNIFSPLFTLSPRIFSQAIQTSLVSHRDRSVARVEEQRMLLRRIASEQRALAITVEQAVQSIRECTPGIYKPRYILGHTCQTCCFSNNYIYMNLIIHDVHTILLFNVLLNVDLIYDLN